MFFIIYTYKFIQKYKMHQFETKKLIICNKIKN